MDEEQIRPEDLGRVLWLGVVGLGYQHVLVRRCCDRRQSSWLLRWWFARGFDNFSTGVDFKGHDFEHFHHGPNYHLRPYDYGSPDDQ